MTHVYQPHAGGFAYFTSGVINGAIGVGGTWTAYSTLTLPAYTLGGTVTSNGQSFSGTIANLGTVTTVDINGGTWQGTIDGNWTAASQTCADLGTVTTADINGGTIDGVALGGASAVSLGTPSSGTLTNCTGLPAAGVTGTALVAAAIGTTVQAYDADLTTWAGVTPAAGVATFLATPSSANLASAVTDETGSGALVFATSPSFTTPTINTAASVGGSWTAAAAWTLPAFTLGGTVTSNGQSFSGTIANLGTVTTADINGGTIDGTVIGGASAAAGTFEEVNIQSAALGADLSGRYQASGAANTVGQSFLGINAYGWTGAAAVAGGTINFRAAETWSAGAQGTYISFRTVDIGGTTLAERVRVDSTGIQGVIGATTPAAGTFTNGSFTGTLRVTGQITGSDGSAAAPAYSFSSSGNTDNGMYLSAANVLSFAIAGTKTATIQADRLEFAAGYHVASATATGTTPAIQSGTYTPGLTSITNVFGTPAAQASQWMRVGNVVTVSGIIEVEPASSASDTVVAVSLPIASSLTADEHLSGTAGSQLDARYGGCVYGAPASDTAYVRFYGVASSTHPVCYHFTYVVL